MDGAFCSASSKTAFILSMKELSDSVRRQVNAGRPLALMRQFAMSVLPVPGRPYKIKPRGDVTPNLR